MPILPAEVADAREIATADKVEEQVVTFDETARTANFKIRTEDHTTVAVSTDVETGERDTVANVDSNIAARLLDLAQVIAIAAWVPGDQVIADAPAAASLLPLLFVLTITFAVSFSSAIAAAARAAPALKLTIPGATTVFTINRLQRVANRFACVVPFLVLTTA